MRTPTVGFGWVSVVLLVLVACNVNRPIEVAPHPESLATYLGTHRPADVLVTDSAGRTRWFYDARLSGDTLRGSSIRDMASPKVAIPLAHVRSLAVPRFSPGRTFGLAGGILATLAVVALMTPKPVY